MANFVKIYVHVWHVFNYRLDTGLNEYIDVLVKAQNGVLLWNNGTRGAVLIDNTVLGYASYCIAILIAPLVPLFHIQQFPQCFNWYIAFVNNVNQLQPALPLPRPGQITLFSTYYGILLFLKILPIILFILPIIILSLHVLIILSCFLIEAHLELCGLYVLTRNGIHIMTWVVVEQTSVYACNPTSCFLLRLHSAQLL